MHNYLQDIVNRQDLRTNSSFRDFLELDTQIPESVVNQPIKAAEIPDLNLGGRDFILLREEGLLFIAQSDMNVASRLDSYLTNVSSRLKIAIFVIVHFSLGERHIKLESFSHCRGTGSIQGVSRFRRRRMEV